MPADGPSSASATPAAPAAPGPVAPAWTGAGDSFKRPPAWLCLQQKTTLILVTLLIAVVGIVGAIFFFSTRSMLKTAQSAQVSSFAYGIAATLGDSTQNSIQLKFNALDKTPNLEFLVLTDISGKQTAALLADRDAWWDYRTRLGKNQEPGSQLLPRVQEVSHVRNGSTSYAVTVPVFRIGSKDGDPPLIGFLHASFATDAMTGQLRFLQAFVLVTCMAVVLLAIPIASLISRNITVPIERLAGAAHTLAEGDLSHRVTLHRRDELGELAAAFNRMADTVQDQQEDIKQINAGLEQKVHQRTAELEKLNHRLQSEISEKEDFLRAVSHDLNAPLRNIAGMASMLALKYADSLEKDALQRLDRIQKNVQVEVELINELLELSRIKTRREKIEIVDLHDLILAVADGFSNDLETRGISLRVMSHLPVMRCEKLRARQVFQNLIDNAIKYMRQDGPKEIRISVAMATPPEGETVFSVADTGMGIAPEDVPSLFHVFRRAKNATTMKVPGKGVGLASVKSIIENYNGRLWVQSTPGQGTTFHFALPQVHFQNLGDPAKLQKSELKTQNSETRNQNSELPSEVST